MARAGSSVLISVRPEVQLFPGPLRKLKHLVDLGVGEVFFFEHLCEIRVSFWVAHAHNVLPRHRDGNGQGAGHGCGRLGQQGRRLPAVAVGDA